MIKQTVSTCSACDQPHVDNAEICQRCTTRLRQLLQQVPVALAQLNVTLTRQARIGQDVGRRGLFQPRLPYSPEASEATDVLLAHTLARWAVDIWRATESPLTSPAPTDPVAYLTDRVDMIRFRPWAATLLDEVEAAVNNAWSTVDLAAEYLEAGTCSCGQRLMARPDQPTLTCRGCTAVYDVAERREQMVLDATERLLPAKDIERLVDVFLRIGATERIRRRIPSGTVRSWASKGEVVMAGFAQDGRTPIYRVGEVFDRAFRELAAVA